MNTPIYVRLADDSEWHYLGRTTEFGIELRQETLYKDGRAITVTGNSYYIEIKP